MIKFLVSKQVPCGYAACEISCREFNNNEQNVFPIQDVSSKLFEKIFSDAEIFIGAEFYSF